MTTKAGGCWDYNQSIGKYGASVVNQALLRWYTFQSPFLVFRQGSNQFRETSVNIWKIFTPSGKYSGPRPRGDSAVGWEWTEGVVSPSGDVGKKRQQ
ncbi:hypothetical protein ElyMa_001945900 [Elysia marginata]|uniref:Uncharacterized protein n=1 Tax=Elysia marginata TaxID=1093978 RepID=A0AAV4EWE4_9GAST|nr:hypothetical protein ElyMa_001945900 [Elysia marginata]